MTRDEFLRAYGWIFENSPWVAERAWEHAPFESSEALHAAMVEEVERATPAEKVALLRAHPDLGARAKMSDASVGEQSGAGLDSLTPLEFERLTALNLAYRTKFGFPFILAGKGATKHALFAALIHRFPNTPEEEVDEALRQ